MKHSVTQSSHTLSSAYTPAGSINSPTITLTVATVNAFNTNGISKGSASITGTTKYFTFTGSKITSSNGSVTAPNAALSGEQGIANHTHAINTTSATATGTSSVTITNS